MRKAKKLRNLFESKKLIRIVGAHNGLTARLVERNKFDGVWASGLEVSTSHSVPDANILTMTQYLEAARVMNEAVSIPIVVDCDTGYGNSNNVIHLVKKAEAMNIAGICIEDKKFPKVNSYISGRQELAPVAEFVGKIMAAKNAQETEDFMVFARVEALIAGWGLEEALKRAHAYIDAGADGIFIHSKSKTHDEIAEFIKAWKNKAPLVICPTSYPKITEKEMEELGVKMVIYANHGIRASIKYVNEVLSKINKNGIVDIDSDIAPMSDVFELQDMHVMKENEKKYLISDEPIRVIIPAAGITQESSLKPLLQDLPLVMLDLHGKSLLQRNVELLNNLGLQDVHVIVGPNAQKINIEGVNLINKKDYEKTYILSSIMAAEEYLDRKTLVVFSDILFEKEIVEKLLGSDADITLLIDRSYKPSHKKDKLRDLVVAKHNPVVGERSMSLRKDNPILKMGHNMPREEANYEFIGMMLLSKKGVQILKEEYLKVKEKYDAKPFYESESIDKADLTDMIQYLIDKGYKISSVEINSGWMEINNFEDYKKVCELLASQ
ncbi:MAG: phosphoenolpyruvate mutase [Nanoarchaeota archaeon]|nr:phosphoenolpyruvate mutase [Nanoarchaeota archaeon]